MLPYTGLYIISQREYISVDFFECLGGLFKKITDFFHFFANPEKYQNMTLMYNGLISIYFYLISQKDTTISIFAKF